MISLVFLVLGLVGLFIGASLVVDAVKKLSKKFGISQTFIGLTVISIGTSLPEIFTSITAGASGASGIVIGTNIGSCLTQITLIFGLTGLMGHMKGKKKFIRTNGSMVLVAIIAMFAVGIFIGTSTTDNIITWYEGLVLILIYLAYLTYLIKKEGAVLKINHGIRNSYQMRRMDDLKDVFLIIGGIVVLIFASDLVVDNALELAGRWNVAESFIGVMIIGVGTALPELSTAIRAVMKKAGDISVGTLLGSNITDPLFSLGAGALAAGSSGLLFEKNLLFFDIPFWFIATMIALFFLARGGRLMKKESLVMIGIYVLFVFTKIRYFA